MKIDTMNDEAMQNVMPPNGYVALSQVQGSEGVDIVQRPADRHAPPAVSGYVPVQAVMAGNGAPPLPGQAQESRGYVSVAEAAGRSS